MRLLFLISCLIFFIHSDRSINDTFYCPNKLLDLSYSNKVLLDEIGNKNIYDNNYRFLIQSIESKYRCNDVVKVSTTNDTIIERTERIIRKKIKIATKNKKKPLVVIDNKAWSIEKCEKRVNSNNRDGDARFVLGGYYVLNEEYNRAIEMFMKPKLAKYTNFKIDYMYEWLGYIYYNLGIIEKNKKFANKYITMLYKEQQVYLSALKNVKQIKHPSFFQYSYALSFIDLGNYLVKKETNKKTKRIKVLDSIDISSSTEAFEHAIRILLGIKLPSTKVYENLHYLYNKLGQQEKANNAQKMQKAAHQRYLSEKKFKYIRNQVLKNLNVEQLFKKKIEPWFLTELKYKYNPNNFKLLRKTDSLVLWKCLMLSKDLLGTFPEIENLDNSFTYRLNKTLQQFIYRKIINNLINIESDFCYNITKKTFKNKQYYVVIFFVNNFIDVIQSKKKSTELTILKSKSNRKLLYIKRKASRKKAAKQTNTNKILSPTNLSISDSVNKIDTSNTIETKKDTVKKSIPLYKKIGILIDDLVGKGDYIGAYRGLKAYEKLLKGKFGDDEIDKTINEVESVIKKKYGKKHLKKLQKELQ